ncbi:uncharacterized protein LOC105696812 [Orussus abietinus]|uniref:uncharacterized protein LOC105696812 n=1 Tax=Orussus abietinus TaxID=222816 RepID=UPI0006254A79|nr:uncharacterized protein LOC105696812 [Orussus abietinus]
MILILWTILVLDLAQAFLTAPLPAYAHGLSAFDGAGSVKHSERKDIPRESREDEPRMHRQKEDEQTVYVIEFETETNDRDGSARSDNTTASGNTQSPLDPWSIVWYIGSFGGLVAFFLIVSCSEWCCRRGARPLSVPYTQRGEVIGPSPGVTDTPPPPYHLFAPPPYDSVNYGVIADKTGADKVDIFVISVPLRGPARQPS